MRGNAGGGYKNLWDIVNYTVQLMCSNTVSKTPANEMTLQLNDADNLLCRMA